MKKNSYENKKIRNRNVHAVGKKKNLRCTGTAGKKLISGLLLLHAHHSSLFFFVYSMFIYSIGVIKY